MPKPQGKYGLQFTGIAELVRGLDHDGNVWKRGRAAGIKAITDNSEHLLGKAMQVVPLDEGTLEGTGNVIITANGRRVGGATAVGVIEGTPAISERQVATPGTGDAIVGQVGFNTPYAEVQHERLDFNHAEGRTAKYLENPLKEHADLYQKHVEGELRKALAR